VVVVVVVAEAAWGSPPAAEEVEWATAGVQPATEAGAQEARSRAGVAGLAAHHSPAEADIPAEVAFLAQAGQVGLAGRTRVEAAAEGRPLAAAVVGGIAEGNQAAAQGEAARIAAAEGLAVEASCPVALAVAHPALDNNRADIAEVAAAGDMGRLAVEASYSQEGV
jgi:hypothetical protein